MLIKSIRSILQGRSLYTVPVDMPLRAACQVMAEHGIGAVLVLDDVGALQGILSERDILVRAVAGGMDLDTATAGQVMTCDPVTVDMDDAISDALATRIGGAFRHLPVLEKGVPMGILSIRDIPTEYRMMFERFEELSH